MILVVAIVCILFIATMAYLLRPEVNVERDLVGIINIEGAIQSSSDSSLYQAMINYAMFNESIKAVVLQIDCPGGSADLVEAIYLDLLELKKTKNLVASLVLAASGGYYIAVASDYIFVSPTSYIGNVGVVGVAPSTLLPSEVVLETGAYKATGFSELLFPFNLSRALNNFISAVQLGRGGRLRLTSSQLAKGMIYLGSEALSVGMADELGSLQKALTKAGEKLSGYAVVDLNRVLDPSRIENTSELWQEEWLNLNLDMLNTFHPPPSIWYLYMSPTVYRQGLSLSEDFEIFSTSNATQTGNGNREVAVDLSHGNQVSLNEMNILEVELMKRNVSLQFILPFSDFAESLENVNCLIVASPTSSYSGGDVEAVGRLLERGGLLMTFYDPAYEYSGTVLFGPMNSLTTHFGVAYGSGYLYNEQEYYGFYRNVYINSFGESSVTQNLSSLVFFTAAHIYSLNDGVALTAKDTYSSVSERTMNYTVIAMVEEKGTMIAFGDLSFLREPNCYVADNYQLILNMVSTLVSFSQKDTS